MGGVGGRISDTHTHRHICIGWIIVVVVVLVLVLVLAVVLVVVVVLEPGRTHLWAMWGGLGVMLIYVGPPWAHVGPPGAHGPSWAMLGLC